MVRLKVEELILLRQLIHLADSVETLEEFEERVNDLFDVTPALSARLLQWLDLALPLIESQSRCIPG